jgi:predicted acetyltransferase
MFRDPNVHDRATFLEAMAEFEAEGRRGDRSGIAHDLEEWSDRWQTEEGFAAYVEAKLAMRTGEPRPGWVHCTELWWMDGDQYVGRMSIRHELNEELLATGGHIGYDVRRSRRREGHATAMLRAALPIARGLGIESALVTCDDTNIASRRVIEKNGGVLEDQRGHKLRFWVPTAPVVSVPADR